MRLPAGLPHPAAVPSGLPSTLAPQLLSSALAPPPDASRWILEVKYDGYRMLARIDRLSVKLFTRNGNNWTDRLEPLRRDLVRLGLPAGWYDGEIVVCDEKGRPDFGLLQQSFDAKKGERIVFYLFDCPYLHGYDLRAVPLEDRRRLLAATVPRVPLRSIRLSKELEGDAEEVLEAACRMGLEGITAKRRDSAYVSRRTSSWLKIKCGIVEDFVIGGYLGSRTTLHSLLLGVPEDGGLRYVGSAGSGLTELQRKGLLVALQQRECEASPFGLSIGGAKWVRPELLAEIRFSEWTHGGTLRHPSIKAIKRRQHS